MSDDGTHFVSGASGKRFVVWGANYEQDKDYRNQWLKYAYNWTRETDPNGHLQMPVNRMIRGPNESFDSYRANTESPGCPIGYSQEETIKTIWR